jgi:hypothetical protein
VGVAQHLGFEDGHVGIELAFGVEAAAGVVEVNLVGGVETAVFGPAPLIKQLGAGVSGIRLHKRVVRLLHSVGMVGLLFGLSCVGHGNSFKII